MPKETDEIELFFGPLDGMVVTVPEGFPVPDSFGQPKGNWLHWYRVTAEGRAEYTRTEPRRVGG